MTEHKIKVEYSIGNSPNNYLIVAIPFKDYELTENDWCMIDGFISIITVNLDNATIGDVFPIETDELADLSLPDN